WTEIATRAVEGSHLPASTFPIVEAICAMAHKLDKHVVAAGIEPAYQRDFLKRLGVDYAQGYFFARPMSSADAARVLRRVTEDDERDRPPRERARLPAGGPGRPARLVVADELPPPPAPVQPLRTGYAGLDDLLLHDTDPKT